DTTAPASSTRVGEVCERTPCGGQGLQSLDQFATDVRSEARAHLAGESQCPSFVVADEQSVQARGALRSKASDYQLLLLLELPFHPIVVALTGLIGRIPALCHHALHPG